MRNRRPAPPPPSCPSIRCCRRPSKTLRSPRPLCRAKSLPSSRHPRLLAPALLKFDHASGYERGMPNENNFQHDEMSRKNPGDRIAYRDVSGAAASDSPAWQEAMGAVGSQLSRAGVRLVMFLHGSILGTDVFGLQRLDEVGGLKRGYSRGISGLDSLLAFMREGSNGIGPLPGGLIPPLPNDEATKKLLDEQVGDAANFTRAYVESFRRATNQKDCSTADLRPGIVVRREPSSWTRYRGMRAVGACAWPRCRTCARRHRSHSRRGTWPGGPRPGIGIQFTLSFSNYRSQETVRRYYARTLSRLHYLIFWRSLRGLNRRWQPIPC